MAFITTNPNPYIINIPELQNVVTSVTGLDGNVTITDITQYINPTNASIAANNIGSFNSASISVFNTMNFINESAILFQNSNVLTSNTINSVDNILTFQTEGSTRAQITNASEFIVSTIRTENTYINGSLFVTASNAIAPYGDIYADGDIYARGVFYPSDEALKDNIKPYELAGELPTPVNFTWKNTGVADIGVIASDVEAIEPLCVSTKNGTHKTVDYAKLTVLLLAEIKQLKKELQEVRAVLHL